MAKYDNITYFGACSDFQNSIINGKSQPYPRELKIIKQFIKTYNKNNTFIRYSIYLIQCSKYNLLINQKK